MKRYKLERTDLKEKMNTYEVPKYDAFLPYQSHSPPQSTVFKSNKKVEEMKAKMKWDQQVCTYNMPMYT